MEKTVRNLTLSYSQEPCEIDRRLEKNEKVSVMALEGSCQEEIDLSLFYENQDPEKLIIVTSISGHEAQDEFPDETVRSSSRKYAHKYFQNKTYTNHQTGWEIKVHRDSYRHEHRGTDETFLAYIAIPQLIENGIMINDEAGDSAKLYVWRQYFFVAPLRIGCGLYRVRFSVQEMAKGMFYYSTRTAKMEGLTRTSGQEANASISTATDISPSKIILAELLKDVNEKESRIRIRKKTILY